MKRRAVDEDMVRCGVLKPSEDLGMVMQPIHASFGCMHCACPPLPYILLSGGWELGAWANLLRRSRCPAVTIILSVLLPLHPRLIVTEGCVDGGVAGWRGNSG
jgi:hypothetical protein